ncbi:glycosyltransferase [bacterium]|jgi:glycosyltransferase involved in cell wall biosynthesis|nr:glycosyltransferase [bacterium]
MAPTIFILSTADKGGERTHIQQITSGLGAEYEFRVIQSGLSPLSLRSLYLEIKKDKPVLIHAHGYKSFTQVRLLKLLGCRVPPILGTIHGFHLSRYPSAIKRFFRLRIERMLCRLQDVTIAVSQSDYDAILSYRLADEKSLVLIPNGVSISDKTVVQSEKAVDELRQLGIDLDRHDIVISVGALEPVKGFDFLIESMHRIVQNQSDTRLRIVVLGEGVERRRLERQIKTLGLINHVFLVGRKDNCQGWLSLASIYLCCSHYEGLPYSVLEAMSMGLPVIALDVPGCRDLVRDGETGLLAPFGDCEAFVSAVQAVRENEDLRARLGEGGRDLVIKTYSLQGALDKLRGAYGRAGFSRLL